MTGGWGTPAQREPAGAERLYSILSDVMTVRCSDGLHEDCHGHLLGVPCCCDCHTTIEENTDDR